MGPKDRAMYEDGRGPRTLRDMPGMGARDSWRRGVIGDRDRGKWCRKERRGAKSECVCNGKCRPEHQGVDTINKIATCAVDLVWDLDLFLRAGTREAGRTQ